MTGRYQEYPEYRDSGVKWLGDVPISWDVIPLKHLAELNPKKSGIKEKKLSELCSFLPMEKLKLNSLKLDETKNVSDVYDGYTYFENEDLLIAKVTPCFENKNMAIAKELHNGLGFGSSEIYVLRANAKLNNQFLFYRLQEDSFMEIAIAAMSGAGGLKRVPAEIINTYTAAFPCIQEQQKIAYFLDHETAKIDTLIAKQEKLIELLKEKRQAVISHAVTRGLPSLNGRATPMKDSGVEWLGEVPEHWRVVKLSYFLKLQSGDTITSSLIEKEGKYPVFGGNGQRGFTSSYNCDGEYVLIGRQGALCGNINIAKNKFFASEHAVVVYPYVKFNLIFISEFLRFMNLGQYSVSAAQPGISVERIKGLKIAIPPLSEQITIAKYLENKISIFERLTEKSTAQITLLKERKTALISAAVTGKIDVRHFALKEEVNHG
ncbi:restriction endonuclease subunit S [Colwellia sp. M166]|uniref:restriction endonuclease subunit S n=1 Tax=Colwellia sp. M166 TaxID=2583805 RepID=UPI00211F1B03|nr:restriction endonuclease subunit S [Colwellia sp. M166]UUO25376.1 restriction endonuclease subunit S [Colwellia sp. M166]|tara:strand:- start:4191 stop:5492 length:1302 start_codon:yes stop_codon:yes gene_type:complete